LREELRSNNLRVIRPDIPSLRRGLNTAPDDRKKLKSAWTREMLTDG
jgi:hypothetical protein